MDYKARDAQDVEAGAAESLEQGAGAGDPQQDVQRDADLLDQRAGQRHHRRRRKINWRFTKERARVVLKLDQISTNRSEH